MGNVSIGFSVPVWLAIVIIVAAFGFAVWSYRTTLPPVSTARRRSLIALRTGGITLLLLALFEMVLSSSSVNPEQPRVLLALDNSESMTLGGLDTSRIEEARRLARMLFDSELGEDILPITFSDSARSFTIPGLDSAARATGPETNMNLPFDMTADSLRYSNIRGVVLLTDGRYNAGQNPGYDAEKLGLPVFTVGIGDSTEPRDLAAGQLFTNEIAYLDTEQPVQIRARSSGYESGAATIVLRDDNGVVASEQIRLLPGVNEYIANFSWSPRTEGTARLTASIEGDGDELTLKNNRRTTLVKVRSNKRRYVIIAGSPNPDFAFLRRHLSTDSEIEVVTYVQRDGASFLEGSLTPQSFKDAETVLLVDYPTKESKNQTVDLIAESIRNRNLPLMVVLGAGTDFEKLRRMENLLPVKIGSARRNETQVFTEITPAGKENPITRMSDSAAWSTLPPVFRNETQFTARPESEVLATIRIGNTRLDEPLLISRKAGKNRSLFFAGYGLWRWELIGEGTAEASGRETVPVLGTFTGNALRWLGVREEEEQVRIRSSKEVYNLGETVRILGQVYDESYQPVNNAEVNVTVVSGDRSYELTLAPAGNGRYEGVPGTLPAGDYQFTGTATAGDKEIGSDAGRFVVDEVGIEFIQSSMNPALLRSLAERTGGTFYTVDRAGTLAEDILAHSGFVPRSIEVEEEYSLRESIWFLIAALALFAGEWFLRKRSGML